MCRMASFFHHPLTGEILVWNLNSHSKTEEHFGLNPVGPYREGHYLPSGEIECRVEDEDGVSQETCNQLLKSRFPTFLSFFRWALANGGVVGEELYLSELTDLDEKGLVIPDGVIRLSLNSLKTAKEAIEKLSTEKFDIVFLDHDLGGEVFVSSDQENTGYMVAKWLSEHEDRQPKRIIIHSLNPVGAGNMKNLLPSADVIPGAWNFLS